MDLTSLLNALFHRRPAPAARPDAQPIDLAMLETILPSVVDCIRCFA